MADRELELRLKVDRQQAAQAAQAELQDLTKVRDAHRQADADKTRGSKRAAEDARRESKQATDALVRDIHRIRDERGRFIAQAIRDQRRLADEGARDWSKLGGAIGGAGGQIKGLVMQMTGLTGLQAGVAAIAGEFARIRQHAEGAANDTIRMMNELRPLAFAKGMAGDVLQAEIEQLSLRKQTLQTRGDADQFTRAFIGSGEPYIASGRIDKEEFDKLSIVAGKRQAITNFSPEQMGRFHAMMPGFMKRPEGVKLTADEIAESSGAVLEMFRLTGADPESMIKQYQENVSMIERGAFKDEMEMGAMMAAAGQVEKDKSGTWMDQAYRITMGSRTRARGGNILENSTPEEERNRAEWAAEIGVTDQMTMPEIFKLQMEDAERWVKKHGAEFAEDDPRAASILNTFLAERGMGSAVQDISAFFTWRSVQREFEKTYMPIAEDPAKAAEFLDSKFATEVEPSLAGQRSKIEIATETAQLQTGLEQGGVENARRAMFERLRQERRDADGLDLGTYEGWTSGGLGGFGRVEQIDRHLAGFLNEQLPEDQRMNWTALRIRQGPQGRARDLATLQDRVGMAGGDMVPDVKELIRIGQEQLEATRQQNKLLLDAQQKGPQQAPPVIRPPRPGGGGPLRP